LTPKPRVICSCAAVEVIALFMRRSRPPALSGLAASARQNRLPFPPTSTHPRNGIAVSLPRRGAPLPRQPTYLIPPRVDREFAHPCRQRGAPTQATTLSHRPRPGLYPAGRETN